MPIAPTFIARIVAGSDIKSLPLTPIEGFVLSRVDGRATASEIAELCGLPWAQVGASLERLAALAVITGDGLEVGPQTPSLERASGTPSKQAAFAAPRPTSAAPSSIPEASSAARDPSPKGVREAFGRADTSRPPRLRYDPAELDGVTDLDPSQRELILDTYYALKEVTYYELLGVAHSADRKEVRSAYFERSRIFHPDSFFGKELGVFKAKMEAVFKAMTEAYQVLSKKPERARYDASLGANLTRPPPALRIDVVGETGRTTPRGPHRA